MERKTPAWAELGTVRLLPSRRGIQEGLGSRKRATEETDPQDLIAS